MTQTGTLAFTRTGHKISATVVWSRKVYTLVKAADGRLYRLRTDFLATGTETERGHVSFQAGE